MSSTGKSRSCEAHRPPVVTALFSAQIREHSGVCANVLGWGCGALVRTSDQVSTGDEENVSKDPKISLLANESYQHSLMFDFISLFNKCEYIFCAKGD